MPTVRRALVGRSGELERVLELVRAAAAGQAGTLMVSGEAGVGKTALVAAACSEVSDVADVVWAPCLPLTFQAVPHLPLVSGLRAWAADRDEPVPSVFRASDGGSADAGPVQFDAWLNRESQRRPVVLVVDDLHWADQSSLDVLTYLVAGPAVRRVALVTTLRTGEVGDGHPLRRWLAHVRRLPGVDELPLGRLDRAATATQLADVLGEPPHQSLVDAVFARTKGNPYLTALLARGLLPTATALPAGLPTALRDAVSYAWNGLSWSARELTRLLAVAGRPQHADELKEVAKSAEIGDDIVPLLREAVDGGVVDVAADNRYWFTHPMLPEVLEEGLLPEERRSMHATFAASLERASAENAPVEHVVALADHHYRAGNKHQAYQWALRGAEAADATSASAEALRLLRRAAELHADVPGVGITRFELLQRIRAMAERAGDHAHELGAIEDVLTLVDRDREPLLAAELLVRRMKLREEIGLDFASLDDALEAVEVSAGHPSSAEHALAVAHLARAELFQASRSQRARVRPRVDEAIHLAEACGSAKALAYALINRVQARTWAGEDGGADAERAQAAAAEARDYFGFRLAVTWARFNVDFSASRSGLECLRRGREFLTAVGAPHVYAASIAAGEAGDLLQLGEWRACVERLREVFTSNPGPSADAGARLTSALLACWQGRTAEAHAHLARAQEIFAELPRTTGFPIAAVRAELALADGDTERATAVALDHLRSDGARQVLSGRLTPLAARAIADDAQGLRDRGEDPAPALARLVELARYQPKEFPDVPGQMYQASIRAMQDLYEAELLRAQLDPAAGRAWSHAALACGLAEARWDEAYAQWRAAQSLLVERSTRDDAVAALRHAHQLATDLHAAPLLTDIEVLARSGGVALAATATEPPSVTARVLPELTPREREVLAWLVAGRTYREIAHQMVISEKTVSAHVSNLLRKTRTSNRIELAQLVHRLTIQEHR